MWTFIIASWKQITGIVGVLSIITSILVFDARYAKTAEVKALETNVVNTIQEVKKSIQLQQDVTRLDTVTDQMMKTKLLIKSYPRDKELQEDFDNLKKEKQRLQRRVETGVK